MAGTAAGAAALRDFCRAQEIDEVYVSGFNLRDAAAERTVSRLIEEMHRARIRVEALLSSVNADEAGAHREHILGQARAVVAYDSAFPNAQFDGIHLDIEPQQRPENKGAGNMRFLAGLVETYRAVRAIAETAELTQNADIPVKLLKGDMAQRQLLLSALPRFTLMLYRAGTPAEAPSEAERSIAMAYNGLHDDALATMVIGLRTKDYGVSLPAAFAALDRTLHADPHYAGWARHSYNDAVEKPQ